MLLLLILRFLSLLSFILVVVANQRSLLQQQQHRVKYDQSLPHPLSHHILPLGHHRSIGSRRHRILEALDPEITPLYPGYGTHFSYAYIGTPPQRQSLIIDTGSGITAFPCVGCQQCGSHTDPYWDPKKSNSSVIKRCGESTCPISQSYSEGSSWKGYKISDKMWIGGITEDLVQTGSQYAIDYVFACQTSETGLFRTQLADGIMGMSMGPDSFPAQLKAQKVTKSIIFALCYKIGGGIMTLGGVDQRLHKSDIKYAQQVKPGGWFTIAVLDISLGIKDTTTSLGFPSSTYSTGKGMIVDSGTTDTYLPSKIRAKFEQIFKTLSGVVYSNNEISLTSAQVAKLPDIIFIIKNTEGGNFSIVMPPSSYMETVSKDRYAFRVYLTESSGGVLGANFMNDFNIIFDAENNRVGFARSSCKYEDFANEPKIEEPKPVFAEPSRHPTPVPKPNHGTPAPTPPADEAPSCFKPASACRAMCNGQDATASAVGVNMSYISTGIQSVRNLCKNTIVESPCTIYCNGNDIVARGPAYSCLDSPWEECSSKCQQSRRVGVLSKNDICSYKTEKRKCNLDQCPGNSKDFLILADARFYFHPAAPPNFWSYVYEDDLSLAFATIFNIPPGNVDMLFNSHSTSNSGEYLDQNNRRLSPSGRFVKLQIQIRISVNDYKDTVSFTKSKDEVVLGMQSDWFSGAVVKLLDEISVGSEKLDHSRYGWLPDDSFQVLRVISIPLSDSRDPITISGTINSANQEPAPKIYLYFLIGVIIAALLMLVVVLVVHFRLREAHAALEKEKNLTGFGSLVQLWNKAGKGGKGKTRLYRIDPENDPSSSHGLLAVSNRIDKVTLNPHEDQELEKEYF